MSLYRRAAKSDASRSAIVAALRAAGVEVHDVRRPVDLLLNFRDTWSLMELKTPFTKTGKPQARKDQEEQRQFISRHRIPVVTTPQQALIALGLLTPPAASGPS